MVLLVVHSTSGETRLGPEELDASTSVTDVSTRLLDGNSGLLKASLLYGSQSLVDEALGNLLEMGCKECLELTAVFQLSFPVGEFKACQPGKRTDYDWTLIIDIDGSATLKENEWGEAWSGDVTFTGTVSFVDGGDEMVFHLEDEYGEPVTYHASYSNSDGPMLVFRSFRQACRSLRRSS
mmetsp:Transcript_94624/g.187481  ORF Transcript_94624/g.187481 Transcript_94624/m.187481 type:complete len:180 (+) Transcript_94624:81-620(+)